MRYALIEAGIVVNIIEADAGFAAGIGAVLAGADTHVGDTWDGSAFARPAPDLPALRAALWERIKAERDRRTQAGGYQAGGKWFHSDTFSRTQQMGLVMLGANIPSGLQWKTMDGSFITMTQGLAGQVFAAAAASDTALFTHAEALRADVDAAADPAAVDIGAGWPEVFGG